MRYLLNLQPDKPDSRDYIYTSTFAPLPLSVDNRKHLTPIVDQGWLGSCTANAVGGFREGLEVEDGRVVHPLSRLFLYYHSRAVIGRESTDSGAYLRDAIKVLAKMGMPLESDWEYNQSRFTVKPPLEVEESAKKYRIAEYHRVDTIDDLFSALADGHNVVVGVMLWESFYRTSSDGNVPLYDPANGDMPLGGHAMLACGYRTVEDGKREVLMRNSWGEDWGDKGYCWMPMEYQYLYSDMWTGVANLKPEDITFKQAVDILVGLGIFDGGEFWYNYYDKFEAGTLTNDDARFVDLAFRKFAVDKANIK